MSFRGFTCWTPSAVAETIVVDAAKPPEAVLLATHHPAKVFKRSIDAADGGEAYGEKDMLRELLTSADDPLLMAVTGPSGSGKSHLVRWLHAALKDREPDQHIVYIPKYQTSLRGVIEAIIKGFDGPEFEDISRSLMEAGNDLNAKTAPVELLNRLAMSFEIWEPSEEEGKSLAAMRYLAGPGQFSALLYDNVFRETLLREGGVIDRFVRQAMEGKTEFDKGEPFQFTADDLPTEVTRVKDAGKAAQNVLRQLVGSAQLRELAAATLTDFLQPAIRDLIGIKSHQLSDIFARVRELLAAQERELVLLIEDFTILQGLQRELLDALLVPTAQAGVAKFARLRTVLAVTTGYFNPLLLDTVRTRVRYRYAIDVRLNDVAAADQCSFVARYLNATRLGRSAVEKEWRRSQRVDERSWIPNACDGCAHKDVCHEAFGVTTEGYGLYPFNEAALKRCIESRLRKGDTKARFDPREVLKEVVEYTLEKHHPHIRSGSFPNNAFHDHFRDTNARGLSIAVEADILKTDEPNADRWKALLTYWGDSPEVATNLEDAIHEAFDLPPLDWHQEYPQPDRDEEDPEEPVKPVDEAAGLKKDIRALEAWREGDDLPQALNRRLRTLLHASLVAYMNNWEDLVAFPKQWIDRGKPFSTDRIHFNPEEGTVPGSVHLLVNRNVLDDVRAAQALLSFDHYGNWKFERGGELARVLRCRMEAWSREVTEQLAELTQNERIEEAVEALLIGAIVLGHKSDFGLDPVVGLDAVLEFLPPDADELYGPDTPAWNDLVKACIEGGNRGDTRGELIDTIKSQLGTSKGGSGPQALDPLAARKLVELGYERVQAATGSSGSDGTARHLGRVLSKLPPAMQERTEYLVSWREEIEDVLAESEASEEVVERVLEAVSEASAANVTTAHAYQQLENLAGAFTAAKPESALIEITTFLRSSKKMSLPAELSFLAHIDLHRLQDARKFSQMADRTLADIERRLDLEEVESGKDSALNAAVESLSSRLEGVAEELRAIAGLRGASS